MGDGGTGDNDCPRPILSQAGKGEKKDRLEPSARKDCGVLVLV